MSGSTLLLSRELTRLDRHGGRRRIVRGATILFFAVVLLSAHGQGPLMPFYSLVVAQYLLLLFLQPIRAAGILVQGRVDGTLPLLGLTPLRPAAVMLGTCGGALALALENLLLALPLISIAAAYGGLEPVMVLEAYLALIVGALLGTALGAWVGVQGKRGESGAFTRALAWMFLLLVAPLLLAALFKALGLDAVADSMQQVWVPFALFLHFGQPWGPLITGVVLTLLFFVLGVRRLNRTILGGDALPPERRSGRTSSRAVPQRWVLAWRERHRIDPRGWVRPGLLAVLSIVAFFGLLIYSALPTQVDMAFGMLFSLIGYLWLLAVMWGVMSGARSYVEDREDGSLELVLTSPAFTPNRIVSEKLAGALLRGWPGLTLGALFHAASGAGHVLYSAHAAGDALGGWVVGRTVFVIVSAGLVWVVGPLVGVALGQCFSVSAPNSERAQNWAATAAALMFFVGGWMTCFMQIGVSLTPASVKGLVDGILYGGVSVVCLFLVLVGSQVIKNRLPLAIAPAPPASPTPASQ